MVEMRSEISGFYKGIIYCDNMEEAHQIAHNIEVLVNKNISPGLHASVKRGCSEYAIAFPEFNEINKSGIQLMSYNEDWKLIEKNHDAVNLLKSDTTTRTTCSGLNLSDILIIRNWIDYAKGIGDQSALLLCKDRIFSKFIHNVAKKRLETFRWQPISSN